MTKPETQIKGIIQTVMHLTWTPAPGIYEVPCFDGKEDRVCIVDISNPKINSKYGQINIYHPWLGTWCANWLGNKKSGKPLMRLSVEIIKELINKEDATISFITRQVYGYLIEDKK